MPFSPRRIEDAPAPFRRLLEHVERLLDGQDVQLVAAVVTNIMARVVLTLEPSRDVAAIDALIDDLATTLKAGCRAQLERDKREHFP